MRGTTGEIGNLYSYDGFGNILEKKENITNRIFYTGQQYDQETGQYYLRARYYNPVIGRFTQKDTYRGDGLNLYAYCSNNPVMYYDPSGYGANTNVSTPCTNSDSQNPADQKPVDGVSDSTSEGNYLYRTVRPEENIENGLIAKNPDAQYTLTGHVNNNGKEGYASQYISTTKDFDNVAKPHADDTGSRVVRIDVDKLPDDVKIYDLSTEANRESLLKGWQAKTYTKKSVEVDIEGFIPADAIELFYTPN